LLVRRGFLDIYPNRDIILLMLKFFRVGRVQDAPFPFLGFAPQCCLAARYPTKVGTKIVWHLHVGELCRRRGNHIHDG
jgi:hypothetical protein